MKYSFVTLLIALYCGVSASGQNTGADMDAFLKKAEVKGYSGSVLVARGKEILLQKGYGLRDREARSPQTENTIFSVGSVTKQFTAAAILKLKEQGKLSVYDPLQRFFPQAPEAFQKITLHELLTHTAGLPPAIGDDYDLIDKGDFMKLVFKTGLLSAPGEKHAYSNVGYSILGIIVEQLSGMTYEQFLKKEFFTPLGMKHTGYTLFDRDKTELAVGYKAGNRWGTALDHPWAVDGPGWHLKANGGILSTTGDLYLWIRAIMDQKILGENTLAEWYTGYARECPDCDTYYGYGWVIVDFNDYNEKLLWHNGGNGVYNTYVAFLPQSEVVVVVSSNSPEFMSDMYGEHLVKMAFGRVKPFAPEVVDAFTGTFELGGAAPVTMEINEFGRLNVSWTDEKALQILSGGGEMDVNSGQKMTDLAYKLIDVGFNQDPNRLAEVVEKPVADVQSDLNYFKEKVGLYGKMIEISAIGSVERRAREAWLSFVKVRFKNATRYFTVVRERNIMVDIRDNAKMEKEFERSGESSFLAPNTQTQIYMESGILYVKGAFGQATLRKI